MKSVIMCAFALFLSAPLFGAPDSAAAQGPRARDTVLAQARHRVIRAGDVKKRKSPPVDVRALAALQAAAESPAPAQASSGTSRSALPLVAVSLLIAGGSTGLMLWVMARVVAKRRRPAAAEVRAPLSAAPNAAHPAPDEEDADPAAPAGKDEEEDDPFCGVGKEMRSAREEFALAMRIHAAPMGDGLRRGAVEACGEHASPADRVKIARRFGVGRGEIDLALRLQKLETIVPGEEEHA